MKKTIFISILLWISVIAWFLIWNLKSDEEAHSRMALKTGQAFFQQMQDTRAWNAHHNGVYVPITEDNPPNPYLLDPLRDVNTDKEIRLTKINPAYMTRQISEMSDNKKISFHITSLNPIREENKAMDWETPYLKAFEKGEEEKSGFFPDGSFRYMAPLFINESCLKCHEEHGYKMGELRGGISVTLSDFQKPVNHSLLLTYYSVGLLGLFLIITGGFLLNKKQNQLISEKENEHRLLEQLKESMEKIKTLSGIVPICMYCKGIRDDKGYWNQLEKFISDHSDAEFSHGVCQKCLTEKFPKEAAEMAEDKKKEIEKKKRAEI